MTLTRRDLDEVEKLLDDKLDEKLAILPTKDEFFGKMDKLMGELSTIRLEQKATSNQIRRHENEIQDIKKALAS